MTHKEGEIVFVDRMRSAVETKVHPRTLTNRRADYALQILRHFAIVAAKTDGEDSAGRQKLKSLDSKELADLACNISDDIWNEIEDRGWLLDVPSYDDACELAREETERN